MHPVDEAIEDIASRQRGLFTRAQVREVADNPRSLTHSRLRSGRWRRHTSRVLGLPGAPTGEVARLWTAHLHVGADSTIGHESAGRLADLPAIQRCEPVLLVPEGSHRKCDIARLHQVGDLPADHVRVLDDLPVTTVERTIADLSISGASGARVDLWLDHLAMRRELRIDAFVEVISSLRRPGKRRPRSLTTALAKRLPGRGVEQTRLERELTSVLRRAGIGCGNAQFPHPGRADSLELVDRAFPEAMLLVEADGRTWHTKESAFEVDRRRDREASAAGWLTVRCTWSDLTSAAEDTAGDLARIHASRRMAVTLLGGL